MSSRGPSGVKLSIDNIDMTARQVDDFWRRYVDARLEALRQGQETRNYVFAIDVDTTTASNIPWKNRTHLPKLADLSFRLKSKIWNATLSRPAYFRFEAENSKDADMAKKITQLMINKFERRKFRTTIGRQLVADFVDYGNSFPTVNYVEERDGNGELLFRGAEMKRQSPTDIAFDPRAETFAKSPKISRHLVHIAEIKNFPNEFPDAKFDMEAINKGMEIRSNGSTTDIVQLIKEQNISFDGFGSTDQYFKQDLAEILIYRGDIFNPDTNELQRNRIIYVMDKMFVIRNEASVSPKGFDGIHHAGARLRTDNLWSMGMLDNLVGMQYRIDHLENLIADYGDLHAAPPYKVRGEEVMEPAEGMAPMSVWYVGVDSDVELLTPSSSVFQLETKVAEYEARMEKFAGLPPETQGIRTPGEKTRFEVDSLIASGSEHFLDMATNFERGLETALEEMFALEIANWDTDQELELTNDITGTQEIVKLSQEDVMIRGRFIAVGAKHWEKDRRELVEMQTFFNGPMQNPKIAAHISGVALADFFKTRMGLEDSGIFQENIGVKEDVRTQAVAEEEATRIKQESTERVAPEGAGSLGLEELLGQAGATATSDTPTPDFE